MCHFEEFIEFIKYFIELKFLKFVTSNFQLMIIWDKPGHPE